MRRKDLFFSVVVSLFLLAPMTVGAAEYFGVSLPDRASGTSANYLTGEAPASLPTFTFDNVRSGKAQEETERMIEDLIPFRADAIVANAEVDRVFIRLSNAAFRFPCHSSFYGSNYVIAPDQSRIYQKPVKKIRDLGDRFASFAKSISSYGASLPYVKIVIYVAPCVRDVSPYNPANRLTNNVYTSDDVVAMVDEANNEAPGNVTFVSPRYDSFQQWDDEFYNYDHHWNIRGATSAVKEICALLGIDYYLEGGYVQLEDVLFCGSQARESLDINAEPVYDVPLDSFDNLLVTGPDGVCYAGSEHGLFENSGSAKKLFDFHELYFGDLHGKTIAGGYGKDNILLIGDSFSNTPARLLAQSAKTLYVVPDLYNGHVSEASLDEYLEERNISTIVMVARLEDYAVFQQYNPDYFCN